MEVRPLPFPGRAAPARPNRIRLPSSPTERFWYRGAVHGRPPVGKDARMPQEIADAVVIGAGPNGLVAACTLADAGWDVVVLEAADEVGGAVKSERRVPGYVHDMYSSFYPLAAASPVLAKLGLDDHGLRWRRAPSAAPRAAPPPPWSRTC